MYIDEDIEIDESILPKGIVREMNEMREAYKNGNELEYLHILEYFEPSVKCCCYDNRIPMDVGMKILQKFN